MNFLRRSLLIFFLLFLMLNLNACFMMPLMLGTMQNGTMSDNGDPKVEAAVRELVAESVGALDGERGLFDRILIGEIKVGDDLITVRNFRQILLETFRAKNIGLVLEHDDHATNALESQKVMTVLNTQLYQTGDRLWLAQQLVDMRTNRILWSEIYDRPPTKATQELEDDTSLTVRSWDFRTNLIV